MAQQTAEAARQLTARAGFDPSGSQLRSLPGGCSCSAIAPAYHRVLIVKVLVIGVRRVRLARFCYESEHTADEPFNEREHAKNGEAPDHSEHDVQDSPHRAAPRRGLAATYVAAASPGVSNQPHPSTAPTSRSSWWYRTTPKRLPRSRTLISTSTMSIVSSPVSAST
jgi:hypothetical protein